MAELPDLTEAELGAIRAGDIGSFKEARGVPRVPDFWEYLPVIGYTGRHSAAEDEFTNLHTRYLEGQMKLKETEQIEAIKAKFRPSKGEVASTLPDFSKAAGVSTQHAPSEYEANLFAPKSPLVDMVGGVGTLSEAGQRPFNEPITSLQADLLDAYTKGQLAPGEGGRMGTTKSPMKGEVGVIIGDDNKPHRMMFDPVSGKRIQDLGVATEPMKFVTPQEEQENRDKAAKAAADRRHAIATADKAEKDLANYWRTGQKFDDDLFQHNFSAALRESGAAQAINPDGTINMAAMFGSNIDRDRLSKRFKEFSTNTKLMPNPNVRARFGEWAKIYDREIGNAKKAEGESVQEMNTLEEKQPAAKFKGKYAKGPTGQTYYSDGTRWTPVMK